MHHLRRAAVFACCLTLVEAAGLLFGWFGGDLKMTLAQIALAVAAGFAASLATVALLSLVGTLIYGPEYVVRTHTICPNCRRQIFIAATVCPECEETLDVDRHAKATYLYVTLAGAVMALVSWWVSRDAS